MSLPSARTLICLCALLGLIYYIASPATPQPTPPSHVVPLRKTSTTVKGGAAAEKESSQAESTIAGGHTKRIVAVGDLHGDLSHFTRILRMAKLVDMRSQWIGKDTVLVQTGDIVDRGKDTIALYRLMDALRPQAAAAGGAVVNLVGNHELMNLMKDWRYVTPEDIATFGGERNRAEAMCTLDGWISRTWRANYSITARVPFTDTFSHSSSSPLLSASPQIRFGDRSASKGFAATDDSDPFEYAAASFVHGGILPQYMRGLKTDSPIQRINEIGNDLMWSIASANSPLTLPNNATAEQREFWSERGPMWDRSYALDENESAMCARAEEACKMLKVRHLVMGHTPNFEGIRTRCGGTVLLIDTGISRAYGGALSALEILVTLAPRSSASKVAASMNEDDSEEDGSGESQVWVEKEVVSALYTDSRGREILDKRERLVLF